MNKSQILPGYKVELENGNVFVVREYKNIKILFPEGSSRSYMTLDELCDENLCPRNNMAQIVKVFNSLNTPIWERKFTRSEISAGYTLVNENGVEYLIVASNCALRLLGTKHFVVGTKLVEVINEDMTPTNKDYAEIIEVRNTEGKVVYSKK